MKRTVISILIVLLFGIIVISITNMDTTKAAPITLAQTVINLSQGDSWNSGASGVYQTNGHEYRYVGVNVNNYVKFNNDLYQIIGVFDNNSTEVNANLVKLIRSRSIGSYSWGIFNSSPEYTTYLNYKNDWAGLVTGVPTNANILLNEYFLNATDTSATYKSCSDWTYTYGYSYSNAKTEDCSKIIKYGIQSNNLRNYIQPVTWYLYGYKSTSYSKQNWYQCERSDGTKINCTSAYDGAYATKVTNKKIGLMYVSDYLYASGYYASTDTTQGSQQYYGQQNWLYNGYEWTIAPKCDSNVRAFFVSDGRMNDNSTGYSFALRPTFYLKSKVYVTGGDGSFHNPYTIACDTCNN